MNKNFKTLVKNAMNDYGKWVMDDATKTMKENGLANYDYDMLPYAFANIMSIIIEGEKPYVFSNLGSFMEEEDRKMFEATYGGNKTMGWEIATMFEDYANKHLGKWKEKISKSYVREVAYSIKKKEFVEILNMMKEKYGVKNEHKKILEGYILHKCNGMKNDDCIALVEKFMEEHNDYVERMIAC